MKFILLLTASLCLSKLAHASGSTVGNGGNGVLCNMGKDNFSIELLDYTELRLNGGTLALDPNLGDYENILTGLFNKWRNIAPKRMDLYQKWLNEFNQEAIYLSGINIPPIMDIGTVAIPKDCELKGLAFQRPDEEIYHGVKRYTINKDLWLLLPEVQKAGLILHELIYREGIKVGHANSYPTRYFNGYLSSANPILEEYASIATHLPLEWVEFGGLLLNPIAGARAYPNGNIKNILPNGKASVNISEFLGKSVNSKLLNMDFEDVSHISSADLHIRSDSFLFANQVGWGEYFLLKNVHVKLDQLEAKILTDPKASLDTLSVAVWNGCKIFISTGRYGSSPMPREPQEPIYLYQLDPLVSWFRQKDGSVIKNIQSIDYTNFDNTVIKTSNGEVWTTDPKGCGYKQQN